MAGAGYKLFQTGDVLTAAQVNQYLNEQTVMVFANAAARTSALTSVLAEGMMSYLQDTNSVEVYNGSSWVNVGNAGDITEVQAGVGISIASGTGPIPVITNSSTDLITTAGDILYGTAADTVARLGIGSAGQVLKVNSGATAPEWGAAPGGGGKVLQVVQDTLETNYTTTSATYNDTGLTVTITPSAVTSKIMIISYARVSIVSTGTKTANYGALRLVVGSTPTVLQEQSIGDGAMASVSSPEFYINVNFSLLHSPATTSATTYKIQGKTSDNNNTSITGGASSINSIVAMEIGA